MSSISHTQSASGTVYLIVIQLVSRGLTFIGNQSLLRYVSPAHLGLSVQLEALSISVLYTARESLRVALLRAPTAGNATNSKGRADAFQASVNAAYFVVLLGMFIGTALTFFYVYPAGSEILEAPDFQSALWLYAVATMLELLSEPAFIIIQQNALFKARARAETSAAIVRCVAALSTAVRMSRKERPMSVMPFAAGQLGYGMTLFVSYYNSAVKLRATHDFSLYPKRLEAPHTIASLIPKPLFNLACAFYGQSIFKWLLTQGDTLFLSYFADLRSQGIFALASNYGGLASRLLFQPVEESSRNAFGRILSGNGSQNKQSSRSSAEITEKRQDALNYLSTCIRSYFIAIVIPCTTLLPQLLPVIVQVLLGSRSEFNSARTSRLLAAYSYYLPFLAINGILDAFVTSVATESQLVSQSLAMAGVTLVYLSSAAGLMTQLGLAELGLVYANIINMTLRIVFSLWYIRAWTKEKILEAKSKSFREFCSRSLPTRPFLIAYALTLVGLQAQSYVKESAATSSLYGVSTVKFGPLKLDLFDLTYLATTGVVLLSSVIVAERKFLLESAEPLLPQRVQSIVKPYIGRIKTE